jgi:hypothetical protein
MPRYHAAIHSRRQASFGIEKSLSIHVSAEDHVFSRNYHFPFAVYGSQHGTIVALLKRFLTFAIVLKQNLPLIVSLRDMST